MYGYEDLIEVAPEQLLQKISQQEIFEWVLKVPFDFNNRYCSPLRTDNHPGCRFEERPDGIVVFVDFGEKLLTGNTHRSCFKMVMDAFNVTLPGAVRLICNKFGLSTNSLDYFEVEAKLSYEKKEAGFITDMTYDKKPFSKSDIIYWSGFMIKPEHLIEDNSFCVKRFTIKNHKGYRIISPYQHCYAFDFVDKVKIYQPYNEKYKWISSCDENCIGNIDNLPINGDELIIQKSYKDHRILRNLEWGLNVIWVQNEGCIPSIEILKNLTERFKIITIFFDNDADGLKAAYKLAHVFNELRPGCVRIVYLPERRKHKTLYGKFLKDPGEFYNKEGKQDLIKVLKQIGIRHG
jgi:hypothetical protein